MKKIKKYNLILTILVIILIFSGTVMFASCDTKENDGNIGNETDNIGGEIGSEEIAVQSIQLNSTTISLEIGTSRQLNCSIYPSNATDKTITWSSANSAIATVSNGTVTAMSSGSTTIIATSSNGKTSTCIVTVGKFIEKLYFTFNAYVVKVGASCNIRANYLPSDAINLNDVQYTISDESILKSNADGTYTALKEGVVTVTASTSYGITATCTIKCYLYQIDDIAFEDSSDSYISVGQTEKIGYYTYPVDAPKLEMTWTSSDTSVVSVTQEGVIEGHKAGSATITITASNGVSESKTVYVHNFQINLPETPFELHNTSYPAYILTEKATINSVEYELSMMYSRVEITLLVNGTKTYDIQNGSNIFKINYKLVNADTNTVVYSGTMSSQSVAVGESFEIKTDLYFDYGAGEGNYNLILAGVAW